ncbi:MAG: hypothetical protein J7L15_04740 [Clostridiales bacterium]|nr:hypothetical protein [Clostridiales bacterium]
MKRTHEEILPEKMIQGLKVLGNLDESAIVYTSRGLKFAFENSMKANFCQIIEYHDDYLVEFRKKTDNIIEGKKNILVSECIIKPQELIEHFENKTGIFITFMGI